MNITCRNLLELTIFQNCMLLTGETALDNLVSFPVMSRSLTSDNLLLENSFVIIADPVIPYTDSNLINFLRLCHDAGVSGILFFLPENHGLSHIPDAVISLAKELGIVLFEGIFTHESVEFVREISLYINGYRLRHNSIEMTLRNLFFFKNDEEELQKLMNSDLRNSDYRLIRIQFFYFQEYCKQHHLTSEIQIYEHRLFLKRILGNQLLNAFPGSPFCSHSDTVILFYQAEHSSSRTIAKTLQNIRKYVNSVFPELDIRFCVSQIYAELRDIPVCFHETFHLMALTNIPQFQNRILTYSNIGIFQLFLSIPKKILQKNYNMIMRPLMEYDIENSSDLLETLRVYLFCDCNIDETSNQMFIHKNTIRYRLKRIEEVMDCNLKSTETITLLYYCMSIFQYMET